MKPFNHSSKYRRQVALPWLAREGQARLKNSSILIVGCGGIGCAASAYLARAGVGRLRIVDDATVDLEDLHRQILFDISSAREGKLKVEVASHELKRANPEVAVEPFPERFGPENALRLVEGIDIILDCSDNLETRLFINELAVKIGLSWIHGACIATTGLVIGFPRECEVCYRCLLDSLPKIVPDPHKTGILGPVAGVVGCIEAAEAIKLLVCRVEFRQQLLLFDVLEDTISAIEVSPKGDCVVCKRRNFNLLGDLG